MLYYPLCLAKPCRGMPNAGTPVQKSTADLFGILNMLDSVWNILAEPCCVVPKQARQCRTRPPTCSAS